MNRQNILFLVLTLHLLIGGILILPAMAATTQVQIVKYANDGTSVIASQTVNYSWMSTNLPVLGDGTTHYYHQGPIFIDDPNETREQELRWNPAEDTNVLEKDMGAVKGTNLKDLCDLVGGMNAGERVKILSSDGWSKWLAYKNVYEYSSREGPIGITWYKNGLYPDTGYTDGMRMVWFADDSVNKLGTGGTGVHAFGNFDWHEAAAPEYWYYYQSGVENYPTTTGISGQYVNRVYIYSDDAPLVAPVAAFSGTPLSGNAPLDVQFTDASTGTITGYAWDFNNDGTTDSSAQSPSYQYSAAGTYTVKLTVTNTAGSDSEVKAGYITVSAAPVAPVAVFSATPQSGTAPLTVSFTDQSTNTPTSWKWEYRADAGSWTEFGSGARNPSRTFGAGTYDIRLTATNAGGSDSELKTDYIIASSPTSLPVADFTTNVTSGTAPLTVKFTDTSTGAGITAWKWDFNNDRIIDSTSQHPVYTFYSPGTYSVNLTITATGGSDSEIKLNYFSVTSSAVNPSTTVGIYRSGMFYLKNNNAGGNADLVFGYGISTDTPLVGDWDGDGVDTVGIYRSGMFYLKNNNAGGNADLVFGYGISTDTPLVGDWDGT
jgi:PKD repeat protein